MAKRGKRIQSDRSEAADGLLFEGQAELPAQDHGNGAGGGQGGSHHGHNGGPGRGGDLFGGSGGGNGDTIPLHQTAQTKYLNYALSVITSRALPDVRDGLKPVQRRILYTMGQQRLTFDAKHRKCATVCGAVMGNYHPHGDQSIYDALVRMAQPFSLRMPLVDGSGNFGSLDGDPPAAMRYTECRMARLADELLGEIGQQTVPFRPNYDGTKSEPVVLPARVPNLLLNGATGIAVGMATNIPPHNLGELCAALIRLLDALVQGSDLSSRELCRTVKGPDFPTGGQVLNTREELKQIYETGSGAIKLRGTWNEVKGVRGKKIIHIDSVPYTVNKAQLVERIGELVVTRKMPLIVNVRDISTDDVRIELELKKDASPQKVMAYLFKHTPLQTNFPVNLTCLIPTENPEVGRPERCDLRTILWHFLHFRLEVVTRRLEHELGELNRRIHILEGFEKVFDALDEIIAIIRKSDGKADAAQKIMARFDLDAEQTDAILELKLYRLARLEILVIQQELEAKRQRAAEIGRLLKKEEDRWGLVRGELEEIEKTYGRLPEAKRRTLIEMIEEEPEYSEEDFIIAEDAVVIITRDGWIKRQREVKDLSTQRLREGDEVLAAVPGSTKATVAFFSNQGVCYTLRIDEVPATTGYGEPIQKFFRLGDGERIIKALSMDKRYLGEVAAEEEDGVPPMHALAVTSDGYSLRFSVEGYIERSTRAGRRFARPSQGAQVVGVEVVSGEETIIAASRQCHAILCSAAEVNFLSGPGKGVILMKLAKDDQVLGFLASRSNREVLKVETNRGAVKNIGTGGYEVTGRGGKGRQIQTTGSLTRIVQEPATAPVIMDLEG